MSLRRGPGNNKTPSLALAEEQTPTSGVAVSTSSSRTSNQAWILSGFLCLLVAGFYLSSSPTRDTNSTGMKNTPPYLRSSSSSSPHILPDFRPIHEKCTVWVAQSSVKGLQGYGVFTTRDLAAEEHILGVPDGVSIPIIGYWQRHDAATAAKDAWMAVWDNYWWGSGVADHVSYEAGTDVTDFQTGFGALPNHHCLLAKLDYVYPHPPYDDSLANRFRNPGAGAFTYSRGRQFTVSDRVKAGSEIFLNYGYCTHGREDQPDWVDHALLSSDFSKASALIWQTIMGNDGLKFDETDRLVPPANVDPLLLKLLPQDRGELQEMKEAANSKTDLSYYLAEHKGLEQRSPEWIEQNGLCLENILPLPSTLPNAGHGAFAQYPIRKDEIIIPAPLLQILDREALALWDEDTDERVNDQLLLNYCFGHPQSTLLLCPDTQAALINHCSTRTKQCGRKGPNAGFRWSRGWDPTSDVWREMSLEKLAQQKGRGLAFEIYALQDIQPGEEIFFDYGILWERAWDKHVQSFNPQEPPKDWITATQANAEMDHILADFIAGDLRGTVEHPHLFTACQYHKSMGDKRDAYTKTNKDWHDLSDGEIISTYAQKGASFGYPRDDMGYSKHDDTSHWPCTVLLKEKEDGMHTVRIHQNPWEDEMPWESNEVPRILTGYQRSDIHYFVRPYKSDQQLSGAFRHPLGVPDDMFPEKWKNLKK